MREVFYMVAAMALFVTFSGCDSPSKLAGAIEGSWSGAPETLSNTTDGIVTGVDSYLFTKTGATDGSVEIATMISLNEALPGDSSIVQPISLSAAAKATAQGMWVAVDDDEISLTIDPTTIEVSVDPDAVVLETSLLTGNDESVVSTLKPAIAERIKKQIVRVITVKYLDIKHFDDIKIKDNRMKFEIGKAHLVMSRQGSMEE
jgi:hypothetical protein